MGEIFGDRIGKRVAFVLGNGAYQKAPILDNPANDASEMTAALARLGFNVTQLVDGTATRTRDTFDRFCDEANRVDVGLIYYSGHGIQDDGTNYVVPIDADIEQPDFFSELISIQGMMMKLAERVNTSLVFLDACRDNPFEKGLNAKITATGGKNLPTRKTINPGLAFSSASTQLAGQAFIAFAAAPGKVAWQGTGKLSFFTEGLLANLETTDLSINNLMLRVSTFVQEKTHKEQEPWTSSSLREPFYFNAGSLIWFSANLLGFTAFLVSIFTLCMVVADRPGAAYVAPMVFVMLAAFALFLRGLGRAYEFMRGEVKTADGKNWWRSVIGGFFGGIVGAPIIAFAYYFSWMQTWGYEEVTRGQVFSEISLAAILTGLVLGATGMLAQNPQWVGISSQSFKRPWLVIGGIVGGVVAGLIVGPPITAHFGAMARPPATPETLLPGSLLGTVAIVFSTVSYSFERTNYRKLVRNACISIGATAFVAAISAIGFYVFQDAFDRLILEALNNENLSNLIRMGAILGSLVGTILGLTIGLALLFVIDD